jgi:hypothetical protein
MQQQRTVTDIGFERLVSTMPTHAPCIHLFWTPRPYVPAPSRLKALLQKLRSSRGPCLDVVACVNVQDCLTPSLAWTLTCAGVEAVPRVDVTES